MFRNSCFFSLPPSATSFHSLFLSLHFNEFLIHFSLYCFRFFLPSSARFFCIIWFFLWMLCPFRYNSFGIVLRSMLFHIFFPFNGAHSASLCVWSGSSLHWEERAIAKIVWVSFFAFSLITCYHIVKLNKFSCKSRQHQPNATNFSEANGKKGFPRSAEKESAKWIELNRVESLAIVTGGFCATADAENNDGNDDGAAADKSTQKHTHS